MREVRFLPLLFPDKLIELLVKILLFDVTQMSLEAIFPYGDLYKWRMQRFLNTAPHLLVASRVSTSAYICVVPVHLCASPSGDGWLLCDFMCFTKVCWHWGFKSWDRAFPIESSASCWLYPLEVHTCDLWLFLHSLATSLSARSPPRPSGWYSRNKDLFILTLAIHNLPSLNFLSI